MDNTKHREFVNRPPILDYTNYDYWKAKMVDFLKSMDNKTWKVRVKGWKHPENVFQDGTSSLKPKFEWNDVEDNEAFGNSKALYVIFNAVDNNMFRLINIITEGKDAWEILKIAHEGTFKVRMLMLQLFTTKFVNLRMNEDESISDFKIRDEDIANTSFYLGENIFGEKISRKIQWSLPKKFDMKVSETKETRDIRRIKFDELIGSLQTFKVDLNDRPKKKIKIIAFVSNT